MSERRVRARVVLVLSASVKCSSYWAPPTAGYRLYFTISPKTRVRILVSPTHRAAAFISLVSPLSTRHLCIDQPKALAP